MSITRRIRALAGKVRQRPDPAEARRGQLEAARQQVIAAYGDWAAHNIHLGAGVYTRGDAIYGDEFKVQRAVQLVEDLLRRPWSELRIADLGCNEGLYACEFALRGASVVGLEGREAHVKRAQFARDALGLHDLELIRADVRTLSEERYGRFDLVFCWGLLYHLDTPELFRFAQQMREVCDGIAIIDTHVGLTDGDVQRYPLEAFWADPRQLGPLEARTYNGVDYWGRSFTEHSPESSLAERLESGWASLDNPSSFWFTRPSLTNLLVESGFASVLEAHAPRLAYPPDRATFVALGRQREEVQVAGRHGSLPDARLDEQPPEVRPRD